jgi:hypothetical protein
VLVGAGGGDLPHSAAAATEGQAAPATSGGAGGGGRPILLFAVASIVTLVAGVLLGRSGNQLASNWGMNGVLFGATFLALFLVADLVAGQPVLPAEGKANAWMGASGC